MESTDEKDQQEGLRQAKQTVYELQKYENQMEQQYESVFRFLRGLCRDEHLAEELTQETIYRAWKNLDAYKGESEFRVWLCAIAKNQYYTWYKKHKKIVSLDGLHAGNRDGEDGDGKNISENTKVQDTGGREDTLQRMIDREDALAIHREVHKLSEPYKEIFSLRVFGELSFREIGELFGKSEHWACVTYHRAKSKINAKIGGKE